MSQTKQQPLCGAVPGGALVAVLNREPCDLPEGDHKNHHFPVRLSNAAIAADQAQPPAQPLVYSTDNRLKEKQEYYRYGDSGITYKIAPPLPDDVAQAMRDEGLDQKYRILWLGCAVVRQRENDPNPVIRGDRRACEVAMRRIGGRLVPWLQPKKLYMRTRQPQGFKYEDSLGVMQSVKRPDLLPDGVIAKADYLWIDYGALEWRIEQRNTGEELAAINLFKKDEVPAESWRSILTIRSRDGFYQEPSMEHVEILRKREWQNRNANLDEVVKADVETRSQLLEEQQAQFEAAERRELDVIADDLQSFTDRKPVSVHLGT